MKISILCADPENYKTPPIVGGIEKRAKVLIECLQSRKLLEGVFSFQEIDKIPSDSLVIGYCIPNYISKKLHDLRIKSCNIYCSGHDAPTEDIFTSEFVKVRFLSESLKELCSGFFKEENSFVAPHGFSESEKNVCNRYRGYFIWCASLGWGYSAKGLDCFIELALKNPDKNFIAYCGRYRSQQLESDLIGLKNRIPNLWIKFDLKDENKDAFFGNAIALCQFTKLREAGNVTTIESILRNVPIITLPVDNCAVNEYLGDFNIKINRDFFINDEIISQIEKQRARLQNGEFDKEKFSIDTEVDILYDFFQ